MATCTDRDRLTMTVSNIVHHNALTVRDLNTLSSWREMGVSVQEMNDPRHGRYVEVFIRSDGGPSFSMDDVVAIVGAVVPTLASVIHICGPDERWQTVKDRFSVFRDK